MFIKLGVQSYKKFHSGKRLNEKKSKNAIIDLNMPRVFGFFIPLKDNISCFGGIF